MEDLAPENGGVVFDPLRRRNLKALPEERVRQALVRWLIEKIGVPPRLIAVEYPLSARDRGNRKRADVVVWKVAGSGGKHGGLEPWLLAECKAPSVGLTEAVADQVRRYAETIRAEYVVVTNGAATRCFRLEEERYREVPGLPAFS